MSVYSPGSHFLRITIYSSFPGNEGVSRTRLSVLKSRKSWVNLDELGTWVPTFQVNKETIQRRVKGKLIPFLVSIQRERLLRSQEFQSAF